MRTRTVRRRVLLSSSSSRRAAAAAILPFLESLEIRQLLTTYTLTDLGTLGGATARPADINDAGQIVGASTDPAGRSHAFLWQKGAMTDLGTLGGPTSQATAINDLGQIIGTSAPDDTAPAAPFLWQNGAMSDLGLGAQTTVLHINHAGQIVGNTADGHGFIWQNGVTTDLGSLIPAGAPVTAADINDAGQVIGYAASDRTTALGLAEVHTVRWQDGALTDLGTPSFTMGSYAAATNNLGQVVGQETVFLNTGYGAAVVGRAFLYDGSTMIQLPVPALQSYAADVNDAGQVVGWMNGGPFLYENGVVTNLNSLIPPGTTLGGAVAINNAGQIVAYTAGVDSHALLLTPDVTPSGPSVQLWDGSTQIATGAAPIDFGATRLAEPVSRTFTIRNIGSQTLDLTAPITLPDGFSLTAAPAATSLAPGASTTFTVRLDAAADGTFTGNITIPTNDPEHAAFNFAITGTTIPVQIIDDGAAGFSATAAFAPLTDQGYANDVRRALAGAAASATWTFANLAPGTYRVSATWTTASNRATNAPFTILNGQTPIATITTNQRLAPFGRIDQDTTWQDLGRFTIDTGSLSVRLSNQTTGWTIADAIRIERVSAEMVEFPVPPPVPVKPKPSNPSPPPTAVAHRAITRKPVLPTPPRRPPTPMPAPSKSAFALGRRSVNASLLA